MKFPHKAKATETVASIDPAINKTAEPFAVALWDVTNPRNFVSLPERVWSKNRKTGFPNVVLFRLGIDLRFTQCSESWRGFYDEAVFVVPTALCEPTKSYEMRVDPEDRYPTLQRPCCHFLTVSLRGEVPKPSSTPPQIITGGYDGVLKTVESMWPTARRFIATALSRPPNGWELFGKCERFN